MRSLWSEREARRYSGGLAQRVYSSRLLGAEPALVLHGGGNTSVKGRVADVFGNDEDVVFVKGSGWDLSTIEQAGFSPCRLQHLIALSQLETLSENQMAFELRKSMTDISAPAPSVEAILHAVIPARFVDHTHADAFLTVGNTPDGEERVREIYGDAIVLIPYTMPGFALAKRCAQSYRASAGPQTIGMALMGHGLFTFGETARESYERMIDLVTRAEDHLKRHKAWNVSLGTSAAPAAQPEDPAEIARLRHELSKAAGAPMIVSVSNDPGATAFARRDDLQEIALRGPATPDHSIRTKRIPMIGRDVAAYAKAYGEYFARNGNAQLSMLDPAPRVILDEQLGLLTAGRTVSDAAISRDIYLHTMRTIAQATALSAWQPASERDIFNVEYWELEQAKLRTPGLAPPMTGEIAFVTGASSGIGKACAESLLARGAAVAGLDLSDGPAEFSQRADYLHIKGDLTRPKFIEDALRETSRAFGGIDVLVLNAGVFPKSAPIAELSDEAWSAAMAINLDANLRLMREAYPLLELSPRGGRVVIVGSKNVAAPGPGAASYSVSKAALTQLARVAALEWGKTGIRVNTVHPNAVFDTAIWSDEILTARAAAYDMSVAGYKTNNVLGVEITSRDVGELVAELCGPAFSKTTGAQIPIDGGNDRVI